ncbi:MAG: HAD-IA family hydrolase [Clostridia bacterium]|nr:HAD-IA family hydrolase [Clostridia bacterium]
MKKYILFDFDNTLVDSLTLWYKVMHKEAFKYWNVKFVKDILTLRKGLSNHEIAQLFIDLTKLQDVQAQEVVDFWNNRMEYYYTHKIKLIKGVRELLNNLKAKGYSLVLVSATSKYLLEIALKHYGLDMHFDHIYTEESLAQPKRSVQFYEECLKQLKCQASDIFLFEDSFASLTSAHSLNIESCGIVHKYNKKNADKIKSITTLTIKDYTDKKLANLNLL